MSPAMRGCLLRVLHGWGRAIAFVQVMNGTIETSLTPHYPALQRALHANVGIWGLVLSGIPVGLLIGAPLGTLLAGGFSQFEAITSRLGRWRLRLPTRVKVLLWEGLGSRLAMLLGGILFFGAPSFAGAVPSVTLLWVVLFAAGLGNGVFDVGRGLQSTNFELQHQDDPRLRDANLVIEALFSFGSLLGVGSAAVALRLHWNTIPHMAGVSATALAVLLITVSQMPAAPERAPHLDAKGTDPDRDAGDADMDDETRPTSAGWLTFFGMCAAAFFGFFPLGVAYAWSTPYLQSLGAVGAFATFGLISYTLFEGVGCVTAAKWRFLHTNKRRTVVLGGLLALGGAALIVGPARPISAIVGFGLLSLGLGPVGPIIQSASNTAAEVRHRALRMGLLSTAGYLGGVVGQPLIGGIAAVSSLRVALALLAVSAIVVLSLARIIPGANKSERGRHRGASGVRRGRHEV